MTQVLRILVCDDHPVVRAGIVGMLASQDDLEVVGEAADGAAGVRMHALLEPDVTVMDLQMPLHDGVSAITRIREQHPDARILVLATYDTEKDVERALAAGAAGYLLKDTAREELYRAVRVVASGEAMLSRAAPSRCEAVADGSVVAFFPPRIKCSTRWRCDGTR